MSNKRVEQLEKRVARIESTCPKNKNKNKNKGGGVVAPQVQGPVRAKTGRRGFLNPEGNVRVTRNEFLLEVKGGVNSSLNLSPDNFPWLKSLAAAFDRVTWHSASLVWKPAVGTTESGMFAMGVDWNSASKAASRATVLSLTPVFDSPVWQPTQGKGMVLPTSKLMSRREYMLSGSGDAVDKQPGILMYSCSGGDNSKIYGEIWLKYDVSLFGTR